MNLTLNLASERTVEEARAAVEAVYARGGLTAEERAVALGNLDEARARIRLTLAAN